MVSWLHLSLTIRLWLGLMALTRTWVTTDSEGLGLVSTLGLLHASCFMLHAQCSMVNSQCSMVTAQCSMFNAECSMEFWNLKTEPWTLEPSKIRVGGMSRKALKYIYIYIYIYPPIQRVSTNGVKICRV